MQSEHYNAMVKRWGTRVPYYSNKSNQIHVPVFIVWQLAWCNKRVILLVSTAFWYISSNKWQTHYKIFVILKNWMYKIYIIWNQLSSYFIICGGEVFVNCIYASWTAMMINKKNPNVHVIQVKMFILKPLK